MQSLARLRWFCEAVLRFTHIDLVSACFNMSESCPRTRSGGVVRVRGASVEKCIGNERDVRRGIVLAILFLPDMQIVNCFDL